MDSGKVIVRVGIIAGLAGIAFGIYSLYRRQWYLFWQYCYKIFKIEPKKFTKDSIEFDVTLKILNRSNFAMDIRSYDLNLYLNDHFITNIKSDTLNTLQPNAVSYIKASINIKPADVLQVDFLVNLLAYYLTDQSKIILSVKGTMSAKANFIGLKKLPIEYTDNWKSIMTTDPNAQNMTCPKEF